ncbi:hypothetical protein IKF33_00980 [Candidatus Saccharibacteria bacterium]|nr:hypothetical protein [Candidatus Saccharibacteria bacterium]
MNEIISSNAEQQNDDSAWGEEYLKSVPEFAGEKKFVKLEEIANLCSFENTMISGHGTASAGNSHEVVESIFDEGVKGFESLGNMVSMNRGNEVVGSTDLTDNTVGLWSSMEGRLDFQKMKEKLDNWPHRGAKNVILMRFPLDYHHGYTEVGSERTQAYFTEHEDKNGQATNYIDRRFIIGNYNSETGQVELNPNFEPNITGDFKKELDERLAKVQEQTKKRHEAFDENNPFGFTRTNTEGSEPEDNIDDAVDGWDDADW